MLSAISVQISKNRYIIRPVNKLSSPSDWMGSECFFTAPEFRKSYDSVKISLFTPKFTLVPEQFFNETKAREILAETAEIRENDIVEYVPVISRKAVLLYSNSIDETFSKVVADTILQSDGTSAKIYPEVYYMLDSLCNIEEYNKVVASYDGDRLYLSVAQGNNLCICNSFEATDFITAEYFTFCVLNKLCLNPEVTVIYFRTLLSQNEKMSLYKYFKAVDYI